MRAIRGNLSLMSVIDLIQWADNSKRSGTLILSRQERQKKIYFQSGRIIFVWSNSKGESIADFLQIEAAITQQQLKDALNDSESLGLPFIGYLLTEKIASKKGLEQVLKQVAEAALIDALKWETGTFEFNDLLPGFVINGPVTLSPTSILLESVRRFDETGQADTVDAQRIIEEITSHIRDGNVELPPIPDIIQQIAGKIDRHDFSIEQIVGCITDQILVTKILRICNSPYYRHSRKVSTIREAVVYIGLKSLMSIVMVHALNSISPKNAAEIRKVLQHCLVSGMIARQITTDLGGDPEQSFTCGLLHDIGKTVLFDLIADYSVPEVMRLQLIEDFHSEIGYLLARSWNLSEDIQESIRYHHTPELAGRYRNLVEVIHLANFMAYSACRSGQICGSHDGFNIQQVNVSGLIEQIDNLDREADRIINLA